MNMSIIYRRKRHFAQPRIDADGGVLYVEAVNAHDCGTKEEDKEEDNDEAAGPLGLLMTAQRTFYPVSFTSRHCTHSRLSVSNAVRVNIG